jgi:hypothetical protein
MLLDPLEEQLDLPAAAIELGDREGWQGEVVDEKDQRLGGLGLLETNAAQWCFEALVRVEAGKKDGRLGPLRAGWFVGSIQW